MKARIVITKADRADDLIVTKTPANDIEMTILIMGLSDSAEDGYCVMQYNPLATGATSLREGSKAQVIAYLDGNIASATYDTLVEAQAYIALLGDSDGYDLIDLEQPIGSASTLIIDTRPPLWTEYWLTEGGNSYYASRANGHTRTDADRF